MNEFFNISNFLYYIQSLLSFDHLLAKRDYMFNVDDYNVMNNTMYRKCMDIIYNDEDWKYLLGVDREFDRHVVLGVNLVILVYIFNTLFIYLKNIKQFMISIRGPPFCIMILVGCLILVLTITLKRVNIYYK